MRSRAGSKPDNSATTPGNDALISSFAMVVRLNLAFVLVVTLLVIVTVTSPATLFRCSNTTKAVACSGVDDFMTCEPPLSRCVKSPCGRKLAPHVDVSVSGSFNNEPTPMNAATAMMVFWSVVPYLVVVFIVLGVIIAFDTATLSFAALLLIASVLNETVLKVAIKQRRPLGSCLYFESFGMPSGHATTSVSMLAYALLEINFDRPHSRPLLKVLLSMLALTALAPVPYSRVYLSDHTAMQVVVGSAEGTILACAWFIFMFYFVSPRIPAAMERSCLGTIGLRNTYRTNTLWWPRVSGNIFLQCWSILRPQRHNHVSTSKGTLELQRLRTAV